MMEKVSDFIIVWKLRFHTIINAPRGCALGARVDGCRGNRASARECAKAHSFLCDCRWNNKRRAGRCAPAGWYEKEVFQKKFFFIYALIIQVRCDRSLTER